MGLMDRLFRRTNKDLASIVQRSVITSLKSLQGGKQTKEKWEEQFHWYDQLLKRSDFRAKNIMQNLKIIRDLNPDASMAIWNFLRLANTGHEVECETSSGDADLESAELLNELAKRVGAFYGSGLDQLINVLLLTSFTQGAIALEVEITEDLKEIVDFHAVDPSSLDFRRNKETGEIELVQKQWDGTFLVLNQEQVFYFPLDPDISDPYGRSPILPILQVVFFQIEVLKDLKRVVHHQGYERFDISVVEEAIMENMPDGIKYGTPEEINAYVQSYVHDIQVQMADLEPDDDFFHTDSVKVQTVGGAGSRSMDATRVIEVINQQIVTALKQLPILLGRNEGTTETHGTIQWQIYVAGIESVQRGIKRVLERAYNVALQIYGRQSNAKITFNTIRVQDRLKEAQAENVETDVKIKQINQGWIDNDEASLEMVGHEAVAEPKPIIPPQAPEPEEEEEEENPKDKDQDEEEEESRKVRYFPRKKSLAHGSRADSFVSSIQEPWADSVARFTSDTTLDIRRFINAQLERYLIRLRNAPRVPTRVLLEINSLRALTDRDAKKPKPSEEFKAWVELRVLFDDDEQMELWDEFGLDWMQQAAFMAGEETLMILDTDKTFDYTDYGLLDALEERSTATASLIQGTTHAAVIDTLWDVVYDGKYSIATASAALEDSYAFSPDRAQTIARTEIIGAARTGQYFADAQSGIVIGKIWRSATDERTRKGHKEADGQVVSFEKPFKVKNSNGKVESLMYPGDHSRGASSSNVIMCRCYYERILEGEEEKLED